MNRHKITDRQWVLVALQPSGKMMECDITAGDNQLLFNVVV